MVGFPGETVEEFEETCRLFASGPFAFCHVFSYSERDGTPAARAPAQIPIPERARRSAALRRLAGEKRDGFYRRYLGQKMRVLFEDPKPEHWPAYTDNYIRVAVEKNSLPNPREDLTNRVGLVRLDRIRADFVEGRLVRLLA
jgi:threonylcarbamoyladenosine tRNA methylthiotransferase MtaB